MISIVCLGVHLQIRLSQFADPETYYCNHAAAFWDSLRSLQDNDDAN